MELKNLIIEKNEGIGTIKINNPKQLNALNPTVMSELDYAFNQFKNDIEIDVIVLTGEGKAFVAGADITFMKDLNADQGKKWGEDSAKIFRNIELMNKPVIAAVNGFALGGGVAAHWVQYLKDQHFLQFSSVILPMFSIFMHFSISKPFSAFPIFIASEDSPTLSQG
jgi:enoyl-CoA hydratase/carnithine racemase